MQAEHWSIYAAEKPEPTRGLLRRIFLGRLRHHSFLMLVNETTHEVLKELHFTSFTADGARPVRFALSPVNTVVAVANELGLSSAFRQVADRTRLGPYVARIKGSQTGKRRELAEVQSRLCFSGPPEQVMNLWNTACRATVALNRADIPFTSPGVTMPAVNCRAGTEMALESMGLAFSPLGADKMRGLGRHLYREIGGLSEIHPDTAGRTLESRLQENSALAETMYGTRPQARYLRRKASPAVAGRSVPA